MILNTDQGIVEERGVDPEYWRVKRHNCFRPPACSTTPLRVVKSFDKEDFGIHEIWYIKDIA